MSTILTQGYNPKGLAPQIKIYDNFLNLQYEYDAPQISGSPRIDFTLKDWKIHGGIQTDKGSATIHIIDPNANLLDKTDLNRFCKIKGQWYIEILLGKNSAGLQRWFFGKIQEPTFQLVGLGAIEWEIYAVGYQLMLVERATQIKYFQPKTADGLTPDTTDTTSYISELVKRLIHDKTDSPQNVPILTSLDWAIRTAWLYCPFQNSCRDESTFARPPTLFGIEAYAITGVVPGTSFNTVTTGIQITTTGPKTGTVSIVQTVTLATAATVTLGTPVLSGTDPSLTIGTITASVSPGTSASVQTITISIPFTTTGIVNGVQIGTLTIPFTTGSSEAISPTILGSSTINVGNILTGPYVDAKFGKGLRFNGSSYVTYDVASAWNLLHNGLTKWSASFVLQVPVGSLASNICVLDTDGLGNQNNIGITLYIDVNGAIHFIMTNGTPGQNVYSYTSANGKYPNDGAFHHIVITLDPTLGSNQFTLWVDTVQVGQSSKTGNSYNVAAATNPLSVGSAQGASFMPVYSIIDDLRIYDGTILSSSQVYLLYYGPFDTTNVDTITIQMSDYQKNYQSVESCVEELANAAGCIYGTDAYLKFFLRYRQSKDSKFFFTNDTQYFDALNWDMTKFGTMRRTATLEWIESTIGCAFSHMNGIGGIHNELDQNNTNKNALYDLSTKWFAVSYKVGFDNVRKVSLFLTRVGVPSKDMYVNLCGDNGAGAPNQADIRQKLVVRAAQLQTVSLTGQWVEIAFQDQQSVTVGETLWVVITQYQDASNTIKLNYQTGSGSYSDSPDGNTWTVRTGTPTYRTYSGHSVLVAVENCVTRKTYGQREVNLPITDIQDDNAAITALIGYSEVLGRQQRNYKPIVVSPPDKPIQLGQTARFRDKNSGLDINADIVAYDIGGSAYGKGNMGALEITVTIEQVIYTT